MEAKIWINKSWINILPTDTINTTRRLRSFCVANCLPDNIVKSQGGWYRIEPQGELVFVERCLDEITFEEIYKLNKP